MFKTKIFAVLIALAAAGCTDISGIPQSATASPGKNLISAEAAGRLFAETCLATAPNFKHVAQEISGKPFVQHSESKTYYHTSDNLSVKVSGYGCSLVFKSEKSVDDTVSELANGVSNSARKLGFEVPRNIDVNSYAYPNERGRYFRIGLPRT